MGREILYCNRCGTQLTAEDFTRGRAHTFEHRQFCTKCLPARHDPAKTPAPRAAKRAPSSVRVKPVQPTPKRSALPWLLGGGFVAAAALAGFLLFRPIEPVQPAPLPPGDPSRAVLEDARAFAKANASSPEAVARRWEQAFAATGGHAEAKRELDRALLLRAESEARELKELEARIAERLQGEQFGAVIDVLEEAKKRHATPGWEKAVGERIAAARRAADERYPGLKAAAAAARAKADDAQVAALRSRLSLWGRKDLTADLDAELAKIVPREPVPAGATVLLRYPEEGRTYNPHGTPGEGGLVAVAYGTGSVMSGFEVLKAPFEIPERGEFWLTYTTSSEKPFYIRFRIIAGDKTLPFNWTIEKPVVGRPTRVKAPMRQFMNYDNKAVGTGERVHSIYFHQEDPQARLVVLEAFALRLP